MILVDKVLHKISISFVVRYFFAIALLLIGNSCLFAQTITYTYDNLGRLTQATYPDNSSITYTYDAAGNRATVKTKNDNYRAAQTITFNAIEGKVYGTADIDPGATSTSKLAVDYTSATPTVATIVNGKIHIVGAGTSVISAVQAGNASFLPATAVQHTLTVTPAMLSVKANDLTKNLGEANPVLTLKYTGFVNGDDATKLTTLPVAVTTALTGSPPGSYPITVSGGASANYTFTYISGTLTISNATDASLSNLTTSAGTFTPTFSTDVYNYSISVPNGINSVTLTPTVSNSQASVKVNGVAVGSGTASAAIPLTVGANAVNIVITAQDGVTTKNYTITLNRAKADQAITFQTLAAVTYGNKDISPVITSNSTNKISLASSNTNVATITAGGAIHIAGAGTTTITATQDGDSNSNAAAPASQTLQVNPALLTITADNLTKITGTVNPTLTLTYNGFVYGDDATRLSTQPVLMTTATTNSAVGDYPITPGGAAANNYIFKYVAGLLTVKAVPAPVISSFTPASAMAGTTVTITGTDFTGATAVSFGGTAASSFTVNSSTSITTVIGAGASGNVSVTTGGGTATAAGFNFVFSLPVSNFKVSEASVTCKGSNNGSVNITAVQNLNYTATISGLGLSSTNYPFTAATTVNNLAPGTYNVCITVAGQPDYQQCFTSVITEPKDLSLYSAVLKNTDQVVLSLNGADTYHINLNGVITTTNNNQLTLTLKNGLNTIAVSSDKPCQGVVSQNVVIASRAVPFPNPFDNSINVNLGTDIIKEADITIYDLYNKTVYTKSFKNQSGVVQLDVSGLGMGAFFLKLTADGQEGIFKMIKK